MPTEFETLEKHKRSLEISTSLPSDESLTVELVKLAGGKMFLMLGNLNVHHPRMAKHVLAKHKEQIEVFFLAAELQFGTESG